MDDFDSATTIDRGSDSHFGWIVPDGWQQGRGAWGGLVVGALIRAVTVAEPEPALRLRAVSAQIVAPAVVGPHEIEVTCIRRGSATATWTSTLLDRDGRLVATLTAVLGTARRLDDAPDFAAWGVPSAPDVPAFEQVPDLNFGPPLGPVFAPRLHLRAVTGLPTQKHAPETSGWVGYRDAPVRSAAALVALVDAWWPAGFAAIDRMRPVATITFSANLLADPDDIPLDQPLIHDAFVSGAQEGYTSETRRLWTADGRLVVENLQSIVFIA